MHLDPPKKVAGHPIEILEIRHDPNTYIWLLKLRIFTSGRTIETSVRYDKDKRITIDTIPESAEAYRILLATREHDPLSGSNPLAEAVESVVAARP